MRICYFTTRAPYGIGESFVLREIDEVLRQGHDVLVIPVRPNKKSLKKTHLKVWLASCWEIKTLVFAIFSFLLHPWLTLRAFYLTVIRAGGLTQALKNLLVMPKGLAAAYTINKVKRTEPIDHIHAHWLATTSSAAMVASILSATPWSCTGHRFDIYANNCILQKVKHAEFIRLIDINGYNHINSLIPDVLKRKIVCIHLGVNPTNKSYDDLIKIPTYPYRFVMPANFNEIKGHKYVVEAFRMLNASYRGKLIIHFFGDGITKIDILTLISEYKLEDTIIVDDYIPNQLLLDRYSENYYCALLLPSLDLGNGEHEGIPVSLMEAMSYGIPVISTNTGGIPELLKPNAGILIPDKDPVSLYEAIVSIVNDAALRKKLIKNGLQKIQNDFNNVTNTRLLLDIMYKGLPIGDMTKAELDNG